MDNGTRKNEAILLRKSRLKSIIKGKSRRSRGLLEDDKDVPVDLNEECLMDALLFIYDECQMQKDKDFNTKYFLQKYGGAITEVKKMRVNLSDFHLGDIIGRGQFAEVRLVKEKANNRVYAMKSINKFEEQVQKYIPLVDAELTILSKNSSMWLTELKYAFQDSKVLYFVMEYVPGGDLRSFLIRSGGKLEEDVAKFYLAELVLAINAVHCLGFAHRDIKPENVLIDRLGHLKLVDFGAASRVCHGKVTSAFPVVTPSYIAPEILQNLEDDSEKISQFVYGTECDYWSLGVVAFECVFGSAPFEGATFLETFTNIVGYKTTLTIPLQSNISKDARDFISNLLTDQPNRLKYNECLRHPFFNPIIWDSLHDEIAPYMPKVKTDDDTSNFNTCTKTTDVPTYSSNIISNAPFVGFTKTLDVGISLNKNNSASSFLDSADNSYFLEEDEKNKEDTCFKLRCEIESKSEQLNDRVNCIKTLESKLKDADDLISSKDSEIAKLLGETKLLQMEKIQLEKYLNEEKDVRVELETRSVGLISDIKQAHQKRLMEFENEVAMQKGLVKERNKTISQLEREIQGLRMQVKSLQDEKLANKTEKRDSQQQFVKSFRGSISQMESRLLKNSFDIETKIQEIQAMHEAEMKNKEKAFSEEISLLKVQLVDKDVQIQEVFGRLDESRISREDNLEEIRLIRKKYDERIKHLEANLLEFQKQLDTKKREADRIKMKSLEGELEKALSEKNEAIEKLEIVNTEIENRQAKIDELTAMLSAVNSKLQTMEIQRKEFYENSKVCFQKYEEYGREAGAVGVLKDQLEKFQSSLELCKQELSDERHKSRMLEEQLTTLQKESQNMKVDLRYLTRAKVDLDEKLKNKEKDVQDRIEKIKAYEITQHELKEKLKHIENEAAALKSKFENCQSDSEKLQAFLDESKAQQKLMESRLVSTSAEVLHYQSQMHQFEKLRVSIDEREKVLRLKDSQIEEKTRKIETQSNNLDILKEACVLLEHQLKNFEDLMEKKEQDHKKDLSTKSQMEADLGTLQDELKKARIELNEVKSLKTFTERKLKDMEASSATETSSKINEISLLNERLVTLKKKNEELTTDLGDISAKYGEVEASNSRLRSLLATYEAQNASLKLEATRTITSLVTLKDNNIQLKEALQKAVQKAEFFKYRAETLNEDRVLLELDTADRDTQQQGIISQQMKLIEYLKTQIESLTKKKKFKFFNWDKSDKENTHYRFDLPPLPPAVIHTTPRRRLLSDVNLEVSNKTKNVSIEPEAPLLPVENVSPLVDDPSIQKVVIFKESSSEHLEVHCVKYLLTDLYLMGCEEGLYSRNKGCGLVDGKVKIDGVGSIYQIEIMAKVNMAIMIEGKDRQLVLAHLGLVRACATAAPCSKPKLQIQPVEGIQNCRTFKTQTTGSNQLYLAVATPEYLHILLWNKDSFKLLKNISTPDSMSVSCMVTTPNSIIFGCEKLFEVDIKNFQLDDFIDESDETLTYVISSNPNGDSVPQTILDVGMSNVAAGSHNYNHEYLLCFPHLGVFVDSFGRRSRSEDIVWSKVPLDMTYRHPYLYVLHFNSVEIITIGPHSFTKSRLPGTKGEIGKEIKHVPESRYVHVAAPRLFGNGKNEALIVGSLSDNEILEIAVKYMPNADSTVPFDISESSGDCGAPSTGNSFDKSSSLNTYSDSSTT